MKKREHAIQSLELAYHKCKEIEGNLAEGTKVSQPSHATLSRTISSYTSSSTKISRLSSRTSRTSANNGRTNVRMNWSMFVFNELFSDRRELIPFRGSSRVQWLPLRWVNRTKRTKKTTCCRHPCHHSGTFLPQRYQESVYRLQALMTGRRWPYRLHLRIPTALELGARLAVGGNIKPPRPLYDLCAVVIRPQLRRPH